MSLTDEEMRRWIDESSYEALLQYWRFAKVGDPFFQLQIGEYYQEVMFRKKAKLIMMSRLE